MKFILTAIVLLFVFHTSAQQNPETVVHNFFQAMADIDTVHLDHVIADNARLASAYVGGNGNAISYASKSDFIQSISKSKRGDLDEQISDIKVLVDDGLANVWMDYSFYYQGKLSHCGVNSFSMALQGEEWKIVSLADSRRKNNCTSDLEKNAINTMLDTWHLGATNADSTSYFDLMTTNSIYVGTDQSEVWSKRQFLQFAAPYFAKGKAWAFTRVERNVYSQDFEKVAWFDEVLDTWMGPCRGSGVVVKDENGNWKVQHYVLSVAVSNDDIKEYLKIVNE